MLHSTDVAELYNINKFNTAGQLFIHPLNELVNTFDFLLEPHRYACFIILYFEQDSGQITVDNSIIISKKSSVICVKPNSIFSLLFNQQPLGYLISFTDTFFSLRYNENRLIHFQFLSQKSFSICQLNKSRKAKWNYFMQCMYDELKEVNLWTENILRSYLNIVLHELERVAETPHYIEPQSSKEQKLIQFEKMVDVQFNLYKKPSHYAKELNISTNYLNKLCHQFRNSTSSEIIRNRIILEAERYLHYTSLSVSEITYKLGFESTSYFVSYFKQKRKHTPEQYRKQQHNNPLHII